MKRLISIALALALVLSSLAVIAYAYTDVAEGAWYKIPVDYVTNQELMVGVGGGEFAPDALVSHAMAATVAWRICGSPRMAADSNTYDDLSGEEWYWQAATWGYPTGVFSDFCMAPEPSFEPYWAFDGEENVRRVAFVGMLFRLAQYCGSATEQRADLSVFQDADKVFSWEAEELQWAVAVGILRGSADNGALLLDHRRNITRAEAAAMLMRFCELYDTAAVQP
ncbi:MAG: S-layer homology domain-containing protein [Oscillospiraceae bacterium]|jgi:hypothetical protein|nr:S-layer homology domain-containing protein [Oscillospiraceae bacterium]